MRMRSVVPALVFMFCLWGTAGAEASMKVTLYPAGGRVQMVEELKVSDGEITFVLPSGADAGSLNLVLDKGSVLSREIIPVAGKDSPDVARLREELEQAEQKAARLEGALAGIRSRMALWENPGPGVNPEVLDALEARMQERLPALYEELAALKPRFEEAGKEVERLRRMLEQKGEHREEVRVTARVDGVSGVVRAHCSYTLFNCGWRPVYRLDAHPDRNEIVFVQEAEISQSTGRDWRQVELALRSGSPDDGLAPQSLGSWILRPYRRPELRAAPMAAGMEVNDAAVSLKASARVPQQEGASYSSWELGTRSIPAGTPVRLSLDDSTWKAHFVRVARPSSSPNAVFLMAEVTLPETLTLPSGEALYLVDGSPVGSCLFSMSGHDGEIYFGTDPRVTVDMKLDVRQSGRKGFVDRRQTRVWTWKLDVANRHSMPVDVRIEDPAPRSADEAIKVSTASSPQPEEKDHVLVWNLNVPAGKKMAIEHTVEASAPDTMELLDGR